MGLKVSVFLPRQTCVTRSRRSSLVATCSRNMVERLGSTPSCTLAITDSSPLLDLIPRPGDAIGSSVATTVVGAVPNAAGGNWASLRAGGEGEAILFPGVGWGLFFFPQTGY